MNKTMKSKLDIARKYCANWSSSTKACAYDKPCEPDKCAYYKSIVVRCASISATAGHKKRK